MCCRFRQLIQDVFPSVAVNEANEEMRAAIEKAAASLNLQVIPEQVRLTTQYGPQRLTQQPTILAHIKEAVTQEVQCSQNETHALEILLVPTVCRWNVLCSFIKLACSVLESL